MCVKNNFMISRNFSSRMGEPLLRPKFNENWRAYVLVRNRPDLLPLMASLPVCFPLIPSDSGADNGSQAIRCGHTTG
jgi:hypothetical protein